MNFIEDLTITLLREKPFYAYLLAQMEKSEKKDVALAAVSQKNGVLQFYYNKSGFIANCNNLKEMLGVIEHELIHLVAGHTVRKGERQVGIWNLACDFSVNQLVTYSLPTIALKVESYNLPRNLAVEEYYELLKKEQTQTRESKGKTKRRMDGSENEVEASINQGAEGNDGGSTGEGDENDLNEKYKSVHSYWDDFDELGQELTASIVQEVVKDAYQKSRGELPQAISQLVKCLIENQIDWGKILRMFAVCTRAHTRRPSWKKINRRFPEIMPGYKKDYYSNLVVAIDTSGSIGSEELSQFGAEIKKIQKFRNKITVIECDAKIQKVYELKKRMDLDLQFRGRGGTDFNPVFEYIKKNRVKPNGIIYLTDGFGPAPEKPFPIPTLWVISQKGKKPVEWGREIKLHV